MKTITNRGIFQEVKSSINIEEVATRLGSTLNRQGSTLTGTCPSGHISSSKTSFHIDNRKQLCHCFNCGLGGDAISLVEKVNKISKWEALKWLVNEFSLKVDLGQHQHIPKQTPEQLQEEKEMISRSMVFDKIVEIGKTKLYLEEGKDALDYLVEERKYDPEILKDTEWFYLQEEIDIKKEVIAQYPDMVKDVSKLSLQGTHGDNFRLAFPYRNCDGIITGIVKRFVGSKGHEYKDKNDEIKYARYDSSYGIKKNDLFGLDKIETTEDTILVVEGYPDALYFQASGIKNITAIGQGLLSKKHLDGIRSKKIKNVIISFDNDKVGADNTEKAVRMVLENSNIIPYVIDPKEYGNYKDPDEYFRANGLHSLETIIKEKPEHGAVWVVKGLIGGYEKMNPIEKNKVEEKIFEILLLIKDERTIADLHELLSDVFSVTLPAFKKLIKSKRDINRDTITKSIIANPIVPFIDTNSNTRCYYRKDDDTLSLGIDEKILENIMIDYGVKLPSTYPVFKADFNPHEMGNKFNTFAKTFNLFTPTDFMRLKKNGKAIDLEVSCPRIFELIRNLIPVGDERKHFINWLSYIFSTREKARTSWVFKGTQGSGKNLFFDEVIKPLFGQNQAIVVDDDRLQSDFNGYMNNKLFVAFNEVANDEAKTKRSVKSKIKSLISDTTMLINEKHVKTYEVNNFANILFFSNEVIPLLIENQDRRFNVIETGGELKSVLSFKRDPELFIKNLSEELEMFTQFLLNYKYDKIIVDEVIENDAKATIKELSMNKFELFANKLKTNDWDWFEQFYPEPKKHNDLKRIASQYMTKDELKNKKVEQVKMLRTYELYSDRYVIDQGKLTKQMKINGIKKTRERRAESSTYYYEWG